MMRTKFIRAALAFSFVGFVGGFPALHAEEEPLVVDFGECKPGFVVSHFAFGSVTIQVVGKSKHGCVILKGGEIENPRWDGFLNSMCVVPMKFGVRKYPVGNHGPKLDELGKFCTSTPRP